MIKKTVIPFVHFLLIIAAYLSPFFLDIKLIIIGFLLYHLQLKIFDECVLTAIQFDTKKASFYHYYLTKLGFKLNKKKVMFVVGNIMPLIILLVAIVYQLVLKNHVPVFIH